MTDWLALAFGVLGFVAGWVLAEIVTRYYAPPPSGIVGSGT